MWRSYQPGPKRLETWRDQGVKTIINLRGPTLSGPFLLEDETCAELGLTHIPFRAYSREAPAPTFLRQARALFQSIEYPAMLHCKSGADRAGLMATLYLFFEEGMPLDKAMEQLSFRYGHIRAGKTGVIDYALEKYIHYAKENAIALDDVEAFLNWADSPLYDPVAVKAAFKTTWWGALLTERLLRRE